MREVRAQDIRRGTTCILRLCLPLWLGAGESALRGFVEVRCGFFWTASLCGCQGRLLPI